MPKKVTVLREIGRVGVTFWQFWKIGLTGLAMFYLLADLHIAFFTSSLAEAGRPWFHVYFYFVAVLNLKDAVFNLKDIVVDKIHDSTRRRYLIRPTSATKLHDKLEPPPSNVESLFYLFMSRQNAEALTGDLQEGYNLIHKKFGRRRANLWYWTTAIRSLRPIVWVWAKGHLMKPVATLAGLAAARGLIDGWLAALVEWVKN